MTGVTLAWARTYSSFLINYGFNSTYFHTKALHHGFNSSLTRFSNCVAFSLGLLIAIENSIKKIWHTWTLLFIKDCFLLGSINRKSMSIRKNCELPNRFQNFCCCRCWRSRRRCSPSGWGRRWCCRSPSGRGRWCCWCCWSGQSLGFWMTSGDHTLGDGGCCGCLSFSNWIRKPLQRNAKERSNYSLVVGKNDLKKNKKFLVVSIF